MEQNIWRKSRGFNLSECNFFAEKLSFSFWCSFHTSGILDSGAGSRVDQHANNVLISNACSKRQNMLTCKTRV